MNPGQQLLKPDQSPRSASGQKVPTRKREWDSEEPTEPQKDGNIQESRKPPRPVRRKSSGFSCPFAKRDPVKYGGANGCTNYSRSLETVIRVCSASRSVISCNVGTISHPDYFRSIMFSASTGRSIKTLELGKTNSSKR
jgi:hypothetical protein